MNVLTVINTFIKEILLNRALKAGLNENSGSEKLSLYWPGKCFFFLLFSIDIKILVCILSVCHLKFLLKLDSSRFP